MLAAWLRLPAAQRTPSGTARASLLPLPLLLLQDRHWAKIFEAIGQEIVRDGNFTLQVCVGGRRGGRDAQRASRQQQPPDTQQPAEGTGQGRHYTPFDAKSICHAM